MKNLKKNTFIASLLTLSILTPNFVSAAYINNVIYKWDRVINISQGIDKTEREQYKNITFLNGYTYSESKQDTTSALDFIVGSARYTYTRTYRTY